MTADVPSPDVRRRGRACELLHCRPAHRRDDRGHDGTDRSSRRRRTRGRPRPRDRPRRQPRRHADDDRDAVSRGRRPGLPRDPTRSPGAFRSGRTLDARTDGSPVVSPAGRADVRLRLAASVGVSRGRRPDDPDALTHPRVRGRRRRSPDHRTSDGARDRAPRWPTPPVAGDGPPNRETRALCVVPRISSPETKPTRFRRSIVPTTSQPAASGFRPGSQGRRRRTRPIPTRSRRTRHSSTGWNGFERSPPSRNWGDAVSGRRRTLLVLGCIVCLLAVASALAADPRLDAPGAPQGSPLPATGSRSPTRRIPSRR